MELAISQKNLDNYKKTIELFNNWFGFDITREVVEVGEFLQANWKLNLKYFDTKCKTITNYAFSLKNFILHNCNAEETNTTPSNKLLNFLEDPEVKLRAILEFAPPARKDELLENLANPFYAYDSVWAKRNSLEHNLCIDDIFDELLIDWIGFSLTKNYNRIRIIAPVELKN